MSIDLSKIRAIDVHVHAEISCHDPEDPVMGEFFDAASAYFKAPRERPRIPEIIELNIGHAIVAQALFDGMTVAVSKMKALMLAARSR